MFWEPIGTLVGIIITGVSAVGLFDPDILDPRRRKGNLDLITKDLKKKNSFGYQDKMRKRRFCFALLFVAGFTIAVYSASLHFLSVLTTFYSP
ncbi:MAG: hypothetical protein IIA82_06900 [Thaumarchaeota archaeon]|nr:hypothetical protein [Nitrososphaerota archaeon]